VSRYINELIEKGDLKPGDKAPSLRKLSKQLGDITRHLVVFESFSACNCHGDSSTVLYGF